MGLNIDRWLVRSADNVIAGPYTKEEIRALSETRGLMADDELCPAGGYWFYVHDVEEGRRFCDFPLKPAFSTPIDVQEEITETDSGATKTVIDVKRDWEEADPTLDEIELEMESGVEAGVLENRSFREIKAPIKAARRYQPVHRPHASGTRANPPRGIESIRLYQFLVLAILIFLVFGISAVRRLLGS